MITLLQNKIVTYQDKIGTTESNKFYNITGGTVYYDGDYKIHAFTADGSFSFCDNVNGHFTIDVSVICIAGGGVGSPNIGTGYGCGGAAGGVSISSTKLLNGNYNIIVGKGGTQTYGPNTHTRAGNSEIKLDSSAIIWSIGGGAAYTYTGYINGGSGSGRSADKAVGPGVSIPGTETHYGTDGSLYGSGGATSTSSPAEYGRGIYLYLFSSDTSVYCAAAGGMRATGIPIYYGSYGSGSRAFGTVMSGERPEPGKDGIVTIKYKYKYK